MGKTHKALKRAESEYRKHLLRTSQATRLKGVVTSMRRASVRNYKDRYGDLKNNLLARSVDESLTSILFFNICEEDESEDHSFRFSASLAESLGMKVLFVDLNLWTLSLHEVFRIDHALGLSDLFSHSVKMSSQIKKVGPGNLYTVRLGREPSRFIEFFESCEFDQFLKKMGERFDYLILNAPVNASFQECRILCSKVDSVVLTLEHNTDACQIALGEKKTHLENSIDKLLGVVINKRRSHYHQVVKVACVVVTLCLILTFGILLKNNYFDVTSKIKIRPIRSGKSSNLTQPNYQARKEAAYNGTFADIPKEKINTGKKMIREQIHESAERVTLSMEKNKEGPPMTRETVPSEKVEFQAGQASVVPLQRKIESDSSEVVQQIHDFQKSDGLVVGTKIENPMLTSGTIQGKRNRVKVSKPKIVVVKEGDNLFRIIIRTYGTFNNKIVGLILRENPEILGAEKIVVGQVIKLPDINQFD
jgi:hypothetical protein